MECRLTEWVNTIYACLLNNKLHRNNSSAIERANGNREWYCNGELHRDNAPAVEWADGTRKWYCHGELHRSDGPAVEWADGDREWYYHGEEYTFAEWLQHNKTLDSKTRTLYRLRYSEEVA